MRVSRLMLVTLRDSPADAEIISHQMLVRGGFIKRVTAGVYAYMPLMWKVIKKISSIVQEELDEEGCLETLLPQLHPAELWEQTGRWQSYTAGEGIMFNLTDRQGRRIGLGPTHEEVITKLVGETITSYKELPVTLYQIQTKFRDEIRPRFGLMRGREFIMKDAYSFHRNEEDLKNTYDRMNIIYQKIFERCGLETVGVDADSGAIGGAASQEFMVTATSGEDLILISPDGKYAANQEKAISKPKEAKSLSSPDAYIKDTNDQTSIEDICTNNNVEASQIIKVIILLATLEDNIQQPILVSIRGDQELNEVKLLNVISRHVNKQVLKIKNITKEQIDSQVKNDIPIGYIGPDIEDCLLSEDSKWQKSFIRFTDKTAAELNNFICGANQINKHRFNTKWSLIGGAHNIVDIRKAKAGDQCMHDNKQKLIERRGIEVGHIFQLGRKYSVALDSTFTNDLGTAEHFWMGCYGIGISRLAQAAIEQNHDDLGIIWPLSISPFEVIIVVANIGNEVQQKLGEEIYIKLINNGIDALIDDRKERAGVKFKDADLIGIPWKVIVGRDSSEGKVELVKRSNNERSILSSDKVVENLLTNIFSEKK